MLLEQILEEVKIGKESYRELKTSKELVESFDEDLDNYKISSLISALNNKFAEDINEDTASVVKGFRKIENKIKMMEDRIEKQGSISTAYARMKYDSLAEDFQTLTENIKRKKVQRLIDKDSLSHAIALVIYEAKNLSKKGDFDFSTKDFPLISENFDPFVSKELKLIEESIGY